MKKKKVAVGLSGGVDSAVSAHLLSGGGYEVVGVHLYCWPPKSEVKLNQMSRVEWMRRNGCRADEDRKWALKTALELKIPFKVLDFSEEYKKRVVDYFYREYEAGRTPNPDVLCNSEIKFGLFLDWALKNGFDYVATGHYAKLKPMESDSRLGLWIPKDKHKDQTYFLWKLTQKEFRHSLFPLGDYLKSEVRQMARDNNLSVADRKDSQGICFIGDVDVQEFLRRRLKEKPGRVIDLQARMVGEHKGVWFYTIGQRGGWQIAADYQGANEATKHRFPALYVVEKNKDRNELVVGFGAETYKDKFRVGEVNWIGEEKKLGEVRIRVRHGGKLIKAILSKKDSLLSTELSEPQRGIASGQSAVFYDERDNCLGGGVIN